MAIQLLPHAERYRDAVAAFNRRLAQGGSPWYFYTDPHPDWIPARPGQSVWREYHLAVEGEAEAPQVRGAYALKPQPWWVRGEVHTVTDWQGPFSEGSVDTRYATLGLRMLRDMLKKYPLLYSWGHGGDDQPVVQMLQKMGWMMHQTPFCLLVLRPARFLRHNALLRTSPLRRRAFDLAAYSGLGFVLLKLMHALLRARHGRRFSAVAKEEPCFGDWADALWQRCRARYLAIAQRDAASMNALVPAQGWPAGIRLHVLRGGQSLGWAVVMDTAMRGDKRFGDLRVGSIVDCLADPEDAGEVVAAATRFLAQRGVDIVVSNQAHPAWARGFAENGYAVLPNKRMFAPSPALRTLMEPFDETARGLHLTNMDGHGPMAL